MEPCPWPGPHQSAGKFPSDGLFHRETGFDRLVEIESGLNSEFGKHVDEILCADIPRRAGSERTSSNPACRRLIARNPQAKASQNVHESEPTGIVEVEGEVDIRMIFDQASAQGLHMARRSHPGRIAES